MAFFNRGNSFYNNWRVPGPRPWEHHKYKTVDDSLRGRRKKRRGRGREKSTKEGKGKGAPALRAGVFVIRPPFSQLIRLCHCQYVTNHKYGCYAAKCNTNAKCNNFDAKCNKIFNAECNNLSTQIVITFLTHNVITQNVIISE